MLTLHLLPHLVSIASPQDYSMRVLNVALNPPRLGEQAAPNPDGRYTEADFLRWIPTTGTAARQYTFVANFVGTTMLPVTNLGECYAYYLG